MRMPRMANCGSCGDIPPHARFSMTWGHDIKVIRDNGQFISAETPTTILTLERSAPKGSSSAVVTLRQGAQTHLTVAGVISPTNKSIKLDLADDENHLAFEAKFLDGKVQLNGSANNNEFGGVFDSRGPSPFNLNFEDWLSDTTKVRLMPFAAVLTEEYLNFAKKLQDADPEALSMDPGTGRALCWGLGALGGGMACAGTFGIGCAAGAFLCGYLASKCSDSM